MRSPQPTDASDDEPLDVLLVAPKEFYYIPKFLDQIIDSSCIRIVGITTVPPALGTRGTFSFAYRLFKSFGPRVFANHVTFYLKHMAFDMVNRMRDRGPAYSPKTLAVRHDIEYRHVDDVNDREYVEYARHKAPDVLVSVAATQKFGDELLSVPSQGSINIHSSLLPEYRGVSPSFWALLNDESSTGITVHYMDQNFDTGDVILQEPLEITEDDTLHSLNTRVARRGSDTLLEALERIEAGTVDPSSIDINEGSYYSMPERRDVQEFLNTGRRFF